MKKKEIFLNNLSVRIFHKEILRQGAHCGFGLCYALAFYWGYMPVWLSWLMLGAVVFAAWLLKQRRQKIVDRLVLLMERESHFVHFPLKGPIFFILGVTLSIWLFPKDAALAGIVTLSIVDSIGTLYGTLIGGLAVPWNPKKSLGGPLIGGLFTAWVCHFWLPWDLALLAAFAGAFMDTVDVRILGYSIDDNLLIPLASCCVVALLQV